MALAPLAKGQPLRLWAVLIAAAFGVCAALLPHVLILPNRVWLRFGALLHRVTQPIVMGLLFFGVITPFGFFMRMAKGDNLRRQMDRSAETYWIKCNPTMSARESMKHLF